MTPDVEVRLLGPIEVVHTGRPLPLGHLRQRCVLAALAAEANRVVDREQLVDRVWGDDPPRSATNVLYGYVGKLRTVLAATTGVVALERRPGGYALAVDRDRVDVHRFHRLLRRAVPGHPDAQTDAELRTALALWRGRPFGGAVAGWFANLRRSLEDDRFGAELTLNDLALRTGRHEERLGVLKTLAAEHPLDERLIAQLMLALYRAGRVSEALAWYARTQRQLRTELGLDPGDELRRLQQRILVGDPGLAHPAARVPAPQPRERATTTGSTVTARRPPPVVPRQLTADPVGFTGRGRQLAALDAALGPRTAAADGPAPGPVAVTGMPGVGKTALALHWAHRVRASFPDGDLHADFHDAAADDRTSVKAVLDRFLRALDPAGAEPPGDVAEAAARYRTLLAGRRVLVVLDGVSDSDQVRPLLPGTPGSRVLVTSRNRLGGLAATEGATRIVLDALSHPEAVTLVERLLGQDAVRADPRAVGDLVRACGHLPLALRIAAAHLGGLPPSRLRPYVAGLAGHHTLAVLEVGGDARATVRHAFARTYLSLPEAVRRTFRVLGLRATRDVTAPDAAALAGITVEEARRHLDALADVHLLEPGRDQSYAVHELIRLFAAGLAASAPRPDAAVIPATPSAAAAAQAQPGCDGSAPRCRAVPPASRR